MNKKGLTVVELIVSFTITITIVIFLIQIILSLTKVYNNNSLKTEILNKQSIISNKINTNFLEKKPISITECGKNCYNFIYENGETDILKINNNILTFGDMTEELKNSEIKDISLDIIYSPTLSSFNNDSIFILTIPIKSDINYNFDIKVLYQFNSYSSYIDDYFTS